MNGAAEAIAAARLLPVVVIDDPRAAPPLGAALKRGGLRCAEITLVYGLLNLGDLQTAVD
jgi:2-dehydro-3-deoxyphosphogluconate aldolase/(4S)-4-hydroxy-2-oxoglutarate aldolase